MSPIVLIVFAPVLVGAIAFGALLLGAAFAGVWEGVEERAQGRLPAAGSDDPQASPPVEAYAQAA